ncbi:MAG: helix-turn-helix transcriptional regulator [Firmicutes bacterium]|nr:helix-turn-helix transcriptional regulator [Bacillota bacterium]
MNQITSHVGSKIKLYRKNNGLSINELASLIHKSKSTLSKYENGLISIDIETLYDISKVLHVNLSGLVE